VDDGGVRGVAAATTIAILFSTAYLVAYETQQFTAICYDAKGNTTAITPIWNSSNRTVGTIDILGLFTALNPGITNITVSSGALSENATITLTDIENITAYCIGNCSNPENVLKDDGNYTRIYGDGNGTNAVVVDLGREYSVYEIDVKFYNSYNYNLSISVDNSNWELISAGSVLKPNQSDILMVNNIWEYSNFSNARYVRIESVKGNLWVNSIQKKKSAVMLISSTAKINHISADNDSYMLVTPDTGNATFIFKTPVFKALRITDNTKVVINYDNGSISKNNGWKMNFNNSILTIEANLSEKHHYIMLEFNPTKESIKTGYYGACCNQFENQSDLNYFVDSNFDWIWYQTSGNVKTNYRHVRNLTLAGKKVILEATWWTNASLVGKTWDDLHENETLLNIAINNTIQQIEGVGKDYIYAVTFNSEEPSAGYDYALLPANKTNYIESNNKIYIAIKNRYPKLKIFAGVHVMQMSSDNLTKLSRDGIVDDWYMPDMNPFYNKLIEVRKNNEEIYVVIWASTLQKPELPPTVTQEAFELGISKGFTNIGFFGYVMKPPYSLIVTTDFFNNSLLPYQRPELYKERMFEMVK